MTAKTKIFVDGNCVVCSLEISHYKRLAPELFEIIDISIAGFDPSLFGLTTAAVNKHMHVETPEGKILKGVDAFAHIWSRLPSFAIASKAIQLPVIHSLAEIGYAVFAEIRPFLPKKN